MLLGQIITGFSLSVTDTVNEQDDVPQLFWAVITTLVTPFEKELPEPVPVPVAIVTPVN
jgi:hypothetical protein